ncbi:MAG: twin-arginine translocation signal domain-containing protein, partial [Planctomycetota bacterium]
MNNIKLSRREFLQGTAVGLALSGLAGAATGADSRVEKLSAVRAITRGPKFHWFSYYDKLQFDPSCRYVLGMEVDFEHRSPKPDDVIKVGMVDLNNGDRWKELGESRAWCWQQGCMLQWRPGSKSEVIWNDRQDDRFVCHILDVHSGRKRTLPHPVYTLSPDGSTAVAPDFRRVQDMRPGYGYAGLPDPHADDPAPKDSGIFRLDLETGKQELIISIAKVISISFPFASIIGKHYINHLLFNTDGSRFIFLHRWRTKGQKG